MYESPGRRWSGAAFRIWLLDQMVGGISSGIRAAQNGIFHVDLRMRPFGQAGSCAVSLTDFTNYYGMDGPAWLHERQAMVKFRRFAGDKNFGETVTQACHTAIYSAGWFDFPPCRARERQVRCNWSEVDRSMPSSVMAGIVM
ncbi:MAG: hypothetical protein U0936_16805 [Planctomycetaceae bacterium]